jgi:rare lipoprotein A
MLRKSRQIHVGAAALTLAIGASAVVLAAGQADAQRATQINLTPRQVASEFRVPASSTNVLVGQQMHVRGTRLPAVAGRQVRLLSRAGGSWRTLATARTGLRFRQSGASWYDDGGTTACGFHASFGVANRDLPCGTKVAFHYGGHTVTAVVDDRGPFVGGRDWDLNQNTAAALGFGGVDTVWSSR